MKVKPVIIGVILLGVYLVSVFAFAILQSTRSGSSGMPESAIINYRIESKVNKTAFIQYGITLLDFEYSSKCTTCSDQLYFLEQMTNNFKKQISNDPIVYSIYLQEISNDTFTTPILKIESRLGNKTILNPTENETFYTLCDLAYIPPAICAVK